MAQINVIGIDPGVDTGVAIYHRELKAITDVYTFDFWECYNWLRAMKDGPANAIVIIEAPLKNVMYARQEEKAEQGSQRRNNRMMSNAASNAREAELLAGGIEALGFTVKRVRPTREKKKADEVRRITGYEGSTNQHVRDAIMLCWQA